VTEQERLQAEIESWTIIRNTAWNQFLTALKRLSALGVKQNLATFIQILHKIRNGSM
jgi:predicted phosphatase